MFLHFPLILGNWCFCNIWAGIFCFIWTLFVPGSCSRLVLYGSMGTKAKPIFPLSSVLLHTSRAFIKNTCLKKADISRIPVPLIQRLSVCTEALSCADWESNLWIGANALFLLLPSDIHWQRGDLHEPLQVPAHLHTRESRGVSQQELLRIKPTHVSPALRSSSHPASV